MTQDEMLKIAKECGCKRTFADINHEKTWSMFGEFFNRVGKRTA